MNPVVSPTLRLLADFFDKPLYIVGGYVRNALCNFFGGDIDLASAEHYLDVISRLSGSGFRVSTTSPKLMTLKIEKDGESFEYTTFRTESYIKGHSPEIVEATDSIESDALRRDFKINAVYFDIKENRIVDPLGGIKDIENRIISCTRDSHSVFSEDGLRLMRLARIAAETGFSIAPDTLSGAAENAMQIKDISPERIRDELDKILVADTINGIKGAQRRGIELLNEIGVLKIILPEAVLGTGLTQPQAYHKYDVFAHLLATLECADVKVRLAAFLHDIGKPYCYINTGKYKGHDIEGGRIANGILTRLKYPNTVIKDVVSLIESHMFPIKQARENTVRRFVQRHAYHIEKLCLVIDADECGKGIPLDSPPAADRLRGVFAGMKAENVPFTVKDLLIDGNDLVAANVPKELRNTVMQNLLKLCADIDSPYLTREKQLKFISEAAKDNG